MTRLFALVLIITMPIIGCEGPAGSEGAQGPEGPVGPAGEDGSMMYSGAGAPDNDIGKNGDYYLNENSGEMYGPKDDSGWGNPIIVLKGEDGQDGEDGSQIHSGSGVPDDSLGAVGDFYMDKDNYDMYGPKTENGWGTPITLKGADGNANVTRYIFPSHDFANQSSLTLSINFITNTEFKNSAWLVYLANDRGQVNSTFRYYPLPGEGVYTSYTLSMGNTNDSNATFFIEAQGSPQTEYERIEVVRIEASNTDDQRKEISGEVIPNRLDISDYEAVAEYYGFGGE